MHEGRWNSWRSNLEKEVVIALMREAIVVDEMNTHRYLINLKNGMLNLNSFTLAQHSPSYLSTVQLPMAYDPHKKAPKFLLFIKEITLANEQLIKVLQELVGYLISSETKAEKAFYFHGGGSNGKSVLVKVIRKLIGEENISAINLTDFGQRFGLENLINKTVNIAAENELDGKTLNTENFKSIVSGDLINIELKYRTSISYKPHCKLVFLVNTLPDSKDFSKAFKQALTREQRKRLLHLIINKITVNEDRMIDSIQLVLNDEVLNELKLEVEDLSPDEFSTSFSVLIAI